MTDLRQILYFSSLLLLVCGCLSSLPTPQNYISKCAATCEPVLSVTHSFLRLFLYLIQLPRFEINLTSINCYILQHLNTCQQFYTCLLILSELQSQFLCVKLLFLVPCVRKSRTVSQSTWRGLLCLHCKSMLLPLICKISWQRCDCTKQLIWRNCTMKASDISKLRQQIMRAI